MTSWNMTSFIIGLRYSLFGIQKNSRKNSVSKQNKRYAIFMHQQQQLNKQLKEIMTEAIVFQLSNIWSIEPLIRGRAFTFQHTFSLWR